MNSNASDYRIFRPILSLGIIHILGNLHLRADKLLNFVDFSESLIRIVLIMLFIFHKIMWSSGFLEFVFPLDGSTSLLPTQLNYNFCRNHMQYAFDGKVMLNVVQFFFCHSFRQQWHINVQLSFKYMCLII